MRAALRIEIEKVNAKPFTETYSWWILEYNRMIAMSYNAFTTYDGCLQDIRDFKTGSDCIINGKDKSCLNCAIRVYYGIKKVG